MNPYDIMSITDSAAAGHPFASQSRGYGYDNVDRLLTATSTVPGNYSYGYDNLDNATSVTDPAFGSITPTYNGLNQVTAFNTNTYSYDNNGNTTSDGLTKTYKWDAENRLIEIDYIGSSNKSVFSYDGLGRRTVDAETVSGVTTTTRYLWCGSRICQTRDGTDVVQSRILPEGEYNALTTQKAVYIPDQLDSVRDVLDATTGNLIASLDYSPYGKITQSNGAFAPAYQYAGLMFHPQSALLYSATRALDQSQHWLNRDLIKEWGGTNVYNYVAANPIRFVDVYGLDAREYSIQESGVLGGIGTLYGPAATHCVVQIDTPGGPVTLGFGPDTYWEYQLGSLFFPVPGEIDQGTGYGRTTGTQLTRTVTLSNNAGQRLVNELQKMRLDPPSYQAITSNCHEYCKAVMSLASSLSKQEQTH